MKIGFVLDDSLDKADGVQQYIITLGAWFVSRGHEVHYLVGQTERTDIKNIHSLSRNIQARFNQNRVSTPLPAPKTKVKQLLEDEKFDVLHVQMPFSPLLAAKIVSAALPETAIIGTFHIIPFSKLESLATTTLGLVLRRTINRFDATYSVSLPAQQFAKKAFGINTTVLPNAVHVSRFAAAKPFPQYADKTITIVFLGRLVERKGCMALLKAVALLNTQQKLSRVRVLICGKGPLLSSLESFVKRSKLGHVVHFVGFVNEDDKARYLSSADIAVFPSTGGESFGIVLIEAMAAGSKVVLGGDNVGYRSVLGQKSDQLVNPNNSVDFAKTLLHFISNKRAQDAANKWQQQQISQYDVKVVGAHLLSSYEANIAKRRQTNHNSE